MGVFYAKDNMHEEKRSFFFGFLASFLGIVVVETWRDGIGCEGMLCRNDPSCGFLGGAVRDHIFFVKVMSDS